MSIQNWFRFVGYCLLASGSFQHSLSPIRHCHAVDMGGSAAILDAVTTLPPMRMRLKNNSVAVGELLASDKSGYLAWLNQGFCQPFLFELAAIRNATRSQAVRHPIAAGTSHFRVETTDGEVVVGTIDRLNDQELSLQSSLLGKVSIPRQRVVSLMRIGNSGEIVYSGLTDTEVWTELSDSMDWQFRAGTLQATRQGASIVGDVRLPSQCEITLSLTWKGVPDFVLHFGTVLSQKKSGSIPSAARLEIWNRNVVLVRETPQDADLVRLLELSENHPQLELSILLDQERGRILVRDLHGKQLGSIHLPMENFSVRPAIQISNHGPSLSVERLEVRKWDGFSLITTERSNQILLNDGSSMTGEVMRLSQDQTSFIVAGENEIETDLPLSGLAYAKLGDLQTQNPPFANSEIISSFEVILADETRLKCHWTQGTQHSIGLTSLGLGKSFEVHPQHVVGIIGNEQPFSVPLTENQNGVLSIGQSEIAGYLTTDYQTEPFLLSWQPHGSISSSPWQSDAEGVVSFSQRSFPDHWPSPKMGEPTGRIAVEPNDPKLTVTTEDSAGKVSQEKKENPPVLTRHLHFVSGDTIDGYVDSIDQAGVYFRSDQTQVNFVEHARLSNLWLNSLGSAAKQPPEDKLQRLMIVPRMNKDDPPTHLLLSISGDWLRCRLLQLDQNAATVEVQREMLIIPRDQIAQIVWLHHRQWPSSTLPTESSKPNTRSSPPAPELDSEKLQAREIHVTQNERGITFVPANLEGDVLIGSSELLGECRVTLRGVTRILFGPRLEQRILEAKESPWVLKLAQSPKSYSPKSGSPTPGIHSQIVGQPAPSFVLDCLDGKTLQLSNLIGKVVVLDFWASWCATCIQTLPKLQQVVDLFPAEEVQLIAVNVQEAEARVKVAADQLGLTMPVALDRDGTTTARYSATSIPQTIVIDAQGIVRYAFSGEQAQFAQEVDESIRSLLEMPSN